MGIKVRGVRETHMSVNEFISDVRGKRAIRAVQAAMLIGGSQAALYTPIDTSTLLNSQYRELGLNGTRITGRIGYSANYAVYVHDPNIPQNFRRATAQKEFLKKGVDDVKEQMVAAIKKELMP
ncbi:hypothetical protein AU509_12120 [Lonsdalea britannica]|uniref:HK97 gp10 family phage protein n=1 Tax=Lonsdalea britannica TaxID=1082704 RepID=A0AAD0SH64_9GAMM|nr:hypothetical protein [Lonsdalea britannica]AXW87822.1 hypothetical protein CKQ53_13145 [Lonsdalea britannica]OSM95944.1 hypothetical protein AU509_12120 [Lonsdalea britannica]